MRSPAPHFAPIALRPSRLLAVILIAAHAAALGFLLILSLPPVLLPVVALLLMASVVVSVRRHGLRLTPDAAVCLDFDDRERVRLTCRDGRVCNGLILPSTTVGSLMTVLNVAVDGRRRPVHVILLPDSLNADDFRRLRVWLRWGPRAAAEKPQA